jgi:hypothetical protein
MDIRWSIVKKEIRKDPQNPPRCVIPVTEEPARGSSPIGEGSSRQAGNMRRPAPFD